ncbi:MAG: hypothetical protein FWG39_02725 [Alphaproteobacteria bacterium]|nr:hypothetical protein [Alphaproteobacteria bacterium]
MRGNLSMFLMAVGIAVPAGWIVGTSVAQVYQPRGTAPNARIVQMHSVPGTAGSGLGVTTSVPSISGVGGTQAPGISVGGGGTGGSGGGVDTITPPPPQIELCPDGTPVDSLQSVDQCMNGILSCVNGGALPNGINDLYNSEVRNAIVNGMMLCAPQVDNCLASARVNCERVFLSPQDVWIAFNSRVIQPSYYSFILRRTGLSPNQAENTCMLLDRNAYGASFAAVSASGNVTTEYNNTVTPYNGHDGSKDAPLGVRPNTDPARGHYARWDAAAGECLVRVAAYLNGNLIKNDWMFGLAGDNTPAEAWVAAGDSFSCSKGLFEFSLYNRTATALVSTAVLTGVGAGTGAIIGARTKGTADCTVDGHRDILFKQYISGLDATNRQRLYTLTGLSTSASSIDQETCEKLEGLNDKVVAANELIRQSKANEIEDLENCDTEKCFKNMTDENIRELMTGLTCDDVDTGDCVTLNIFTQQKNSLEALVKKLGFDGTIRVGGKAVKGALIGAGIGAGVGGVATAIAWFTEKNNIQCRVGDGLDRVSVDKSKRIDSLKDFYVKWALQLPDTITPTALVTDCASWRAACGTITDVSVNGGCVNATINYRPLEGGQIREISNACVPSGSICIENRPVARLNMVCDI